MAADASRSERPTILLRTDEHEVVAEAIQALRGEPALYQRDGELVRVTRGQPPRQSVVRSSECVRIERLPSAALRELLAARVRFVRIGKDEQEKAAHPPDWLVSEVLARGHWPGIRVLTGVTTTPLLRPDGTILQTSGYDAATGLLYEPAGDHVAIHDHPSAEDARYALEELQELVVDFPFAKAGHQAVYLAALLTPFARHAFAGPAPLFVIDANTPGTGKSLLADVIGMITSGQPMARMPYVKSDDEMRKRITAVAQQGDRLCLIDNVAGVLGGPSLDAALTSVSWRDRILGESKTTREVALNAVWYATGNNIVLGADTGRRALHIRLESPLERPEERRGFAHPDLLRWIGLHRGAYVRAVLTILRAYYVAGQPPVDLQSFGSYEQWSKHVRAPLVWCGCPDPCSTRSELLSVADHENELVRRAVTTLAELITEPGGLTSNELVEKIRRAPTDKYKSVLAEWVGKTDDGGAPQPRAFGMKLRHVRGRVVAGMRVEKAGDRWLVRKDADSDSGASGGSRSGSPARPGSEDTPP